MSRRNAISAPFSRALHGEKAHKIWSRAGVKLGEFGSVEIQACLKSSALHTR